MMSEVDVRAAITAAHGAAARAVATLACRHMPPVPDPSTGWDDDAVIAQIHDLREALYGRRCGCLPEVSLGYLRELVAGWAWLFDSAAQYARGVPGASLEVIATRDELDVRLSLADRYAPALEPAADRTC